MESKRTLAVAAAMILPFLALSGCGGGGGAVLTDQSMLSQLSSRELLESPTVGKFAPAAAAAKVRLGSVTQSSNIDADGVTFDKVQTEFTPTAGGNFFSVEKIDTKGTDGEEDDEVVWRINNVRVESVTLFTLEREPPLQNFLHSQAVDGNGDRFGDDTFLAAALSAFDFSHLRKDGKQEYLSFGYWAFLKFNPDTQGLDAQELGTFVDGNDFTGNLPNSGSAAYRGIGNLLYYPNRPSINQEAGLVPAAVNFTAVFSGNTAETKMRGDARIYFDARPNIIFNFNEASYDDTLGGFVDGAISCGVSASCHNPEGESIGTWGGQFFDGEDTNTGAGQKPKLFGGTFGVKNLQIGSDRGDTINGIGTFATEIRP